jgi:hypothetical protein
MCSMSIPLLILWVHAVPWVPFSFTHGIPYLYSLVFINGSFSKGLFHALFYLVHARDIPDGVSIQY